ncbi:carboxymuconolactone decarboxylase family protein [Chromobacterium alticapitis]|uniref:Alkylhydroperoxidase n=1 Tax=Chromobacterium alticapitis TaxID=2073169 RepID=A0A2S5DG90_9NEIS|nr:peroxidase-related enzyme [Chromobacterium alticapitis]POZ62037.1 alkylhydroperoxidase [Chromobacterium alticapitis]
MNRIAIPAAEHIPAASQPLLAAVQQQLGMVPNLMKLLAHSPAALEGYLSLNGALGKGKLGAALRERIALAVAEFNGCDYCLSAHSYLAKHVAKLGDDEIAAARDFASADAKQAAALRFALNVAEQRGRMADVELAALRGAGFDEAETLEIVAVVALNILTNYVNNAAATAVDFPLVQARG